MNGRSKWGHENWITPGLLEAIVLVRMGCVAEAGGAGVRAAG
nr:hypothetical protein [Kibdelosporangium sp. MJ126-NF4]